MRAVRIAFAVVAWLFLAGVVVQVLLAGASLFQRADWATHREFGWTLPMLPIVLLVLAASGRFERRVFAPTVALTVAAMLQPELAMARFDAPLIAALHPLNAMLLFWLAWTVAWRSLELARLPGRRPAAPDDRRADDARAAASDGPAATPVDPG